MQESPALPKNAERLGIVRLARDSAIELILTSILLFGVVTIVRWVIGPSPISRAIPGIHAELWIVGAAVALLLAGLILTLREEPRERTRTPQSRWPCGASESSLELGSSPTPSPNCSVLYLESSPLA